MLSYYVSGICPSPSGVTWYGLILMSEVVGAFLLVALGTRSDKMFQNSFCIIIASSSLYEHIN